MEGSSDRDAGDEGLSLVLCLPVFGSQGSVVSLCGPGNVLTVSCVGTEA